MTNPDKMTLEQARDAFRQARDEVARLRTMLAFRQQRDSEPEFDFTTVIGVLDFMRAEAGIPVRELTERMGIPHTTASRIFFRARFTDAMPVEQLVQIADAIGVPLSRALEVWEDHRRRTLAPEPLTTANPNETNV